MSFVQRFAGGRVAMAAIVALGLAGCVKVGPDYTEPNIDLPAGFKNGSSKNAVAIETMWWKDLNDPVLNKLIDQGALENLDLKIALARIEQSRALLRTTGLNAQVSGDLQKSYDRISVEPLSPTNTDTESFNAGYVFDIFGGFARGRERALARFEARRFEVGMARLAYLSEIVTSYVHVRHFQRVEQIARTAIANDRRTVRLTRDKRDAGLATDLEVQQALVRLAKSESELPIHQANFDVQVQRIASLLALKNQEIPKEIRATKGQVRPKTIPDNGIPADLLRNRPDIRAAERNFAAETAGIGVEASELFPQLSILGAISNDGRETWSLNRTISVPILARGRIIARRDAQIARAAEAETQWRKTVVDAVEEVQVSLRENHGWKQQIASLKKAISASQRLRELSVEQFNSGVIPLSDVLSANTQFTELQFLLANAERQYALSWSKIQVATGQGWANDLMHAGEKNPANEPVDPLGVGVLAKKK